MRPAVRENNRPYEGRKRTNEMKQSVWLQTIYGTMRQLPRFADESEAQLGETVRAFLDVESLDDVPESEYDWALGKISARVEEHLDDDTPAAVAPGWETEDDDAQEWYQDAVEWEDSLMAATGQKRQRANDWTASATPQITLIAPSGNEYKMTGHNGLDSFEMVRTVAEMEIALELLVQEYGFTVKRRQQAQPAARQAVQHRREIDRALSSIPGEKHLRGDPPGGPQVGSGRPADQPAQDDEPGQKVFGVDDLCYPDHEYILEAGRMVGDPTQKGGARVQFVYTHSQYDTGVPAFEGKEGKTFKHIHEVTGYDPNDFLAGVSIDFDPPLSVVFRLGKQKANGKGRYLEFVRIEAQGDDTPF